MIVFVQMLQILPPQQEVHVTELLCLTIAFKPLYQSLNSFKTLNLDIPTKFQFIFLGILTRSKLKK
jgi:hypothetical protein